MQFHKSIDTNSMWRDTINTFIHDNIIDELPIYLINVNRSKILFYASQWINEEIKQIPDDIKNKLTNYYIVDESYDEIEDKVERLRAVSIEMIKIAKLSHDEHIQLMHKLKPRLIHNQQLFFNHKLLFDYLLRCIR